MNKVEDILISIGRGKPWDLKPEGLWLEDPGLDVENTARVLMESGARLVTISASSLDSGEFRVIYHWDLEGILLNCATRTRQKILPGIGGFCPAADWIEREIHDYYKVDFTGRELTTLMLDDRDAAGAFSSKFPRKRRPGGSK
jgi:NADH:ubiquinone oxidoreductase subunit C